MPITYNGTNITNGTYNNSTGVVTYNGSQIGPVGTKTGVFIESYSSQPGIFDVYLEDTQAGTSNYHIELSYPAANQTVGDIGIVYDLNSLYYEFEVQLV